MSMRIGFSGDPSPENVVALLCPPVLPPNSSTVGRSEAGGGERAEGASMGISSCAREAQKGKLGNPVSGIVSWKLLISDSFSND
jgi:hypothetical protein